MRYRHPTNPDLTSSGPENACERNKILRRLYKASQRKLQDRTCRMLFGTITFFVVVTYAFSSGRSLSLGGAENAEALEVSTWNIAAINNNPFEYWITYDNALYNRLMEEVQDFISNPGRRDVLVSAVFTPEMFRELVRLMNAKGWLGVSEVKKLWRSDYSKRKIISQFMKDGALGKKRLASMPDRVTNTMAIAGKKYYRPTVINCYDKSFGSYEDWWKQWKEFMFETKIQGKTPSDMLHKIPKAKYQAITVAEEAISIPLQTLAIAIFDSILVHMMMQLEKDEWQDLRKSMCHSLNLRKNSRILEILEQSYADRDVFFLQEAAVSFIAEAERSAIISSNFHIMKPAIQSKNNQNSVILLNKRLFNLNSIEDLTPQLKFSQPKMVAAGDILCIRTSRFILASFHGDTNGMATIPVVKAVVELASKYPDQDLLFGLDANTYEHAKPGVTQDVLEFAQVYGGLGLTSCWGDTPDPTNHTTCNARTYLQPQLNKAAKLSELSKKGDVNPKDFILFQKSRFRSVVTFKDNTGKRRYIEKATGATTPYVFPTLEFPSDHGILSTRISRTNT